MPFVLKHNVTSEIFTCPLINKYDIPYFGTKFWNDIPEAEQEMNHFLEAQETVHPEDWELFEVEELQLKLFNVKLNNNPSKSLFLDDNGKAKTQ